MIMLFRQYPDAIMRTQEIAEACRFRLGALRYQYPEEITTSGQIPQPELERLTWQGAKEYYGDNLPEKIKATNYLA